jgi:hypothetical protein
MSERHDDLTRRILELRMKSDSSLAWLDEYEKNVLQDDTSESAARVRSLLRQLRNATIQADSHSVAADAKARVGDLDRLIEHREQFSDASNEAVSLWNALFDALEEHERQVFEKERGGGNG